MALDLDYLDNLDTFGPGAADRDLDAFLSGADLDVDPFDLVDPFAPDDDDLGDDFDPFATVA